MTNTFKQLLQFDEILLNSDFIKRLAAPIPRMLEIVSENVFLVPNSVSIFIFVFMLSAEIEFIMS